MHYTSFLLSGTVSTLFCHLMKQVKMRYSVEGIMHLWVFSPRGVWGEWWDNPRELDNFEKLVSNSTILCLKSPGHASKFRHNFF